MKKHVQIDAHEAENAVVVIRKETVERDIHKEAQHGMQVLGVMPGTLKSGPSRH